MNPTERFLAQYGIDADATEIPPPVGHDIEGIQLMNQHLQAVAVGEAKILHEISWMRFVG